MRLLLVEDSTRLRDNIAAALRRSGFALDTAADGEEGLWQATQTDYDAIILDIMLPKIDGLELLRRMRAAGRDNPVLLLTARGAVQDRVHGLNAGADDYLTKPFALEELLARVNVLCRRRYRQPAAALEVGDLTIDSSSKRVWRNDDEEILLKPREYALLEFLAHRRDSVVSRTEIEEHIYDGQVDPMSNVVDSAICLLRRTLTRHGATLRITTRRGLGYVLEVPESPPCAPSAGS